MLILNLGSYSKHLAKKIQYYVLICSLAPQVGLYRPDNSLRIRNFSKKSRCDTNEASVP